MLDTNIVSDLIQNPAGRAAARLSLHGDEGLCISIITAAELQFGAASKGSIKLRSKIDAIFETVDVVPFETPADIAYGKLRAHLQKRGRPIGPNDLLIAAHAIALGVTFVTRNLKEFGRVPGLVIENWLA